MTVYRRLNESGRKLEAKIAAVAHQLGILRPQMGTHRAIKAVLAKMLWPDKFSSNNELWKTYKTTRGPYYAHARQMARLQESVVPEIGADF